MRLDLVVPARNEAANIQDALRRLTSALQEIKLQSSDFNLQKSEQIDWRIMVMVNGTTDDTLQRVEDFKLQNSNFKIVALVCLGEGKGAAIKYAAENSDAELFGFIDADLSADPDMIAPMVGSVLADEADVVIGSRLMQTRTTNRGWLRTLSSKLFNLAAHLSLGLRVKDAQCGLKVMNAKARELLASCQEDGWFLDIEFLAKAVQDGLRIREIPVPWIEFRYAGRKSQIRYVRDGLGMVKALLRIRRRLKGYA